MTCCAPDRETGPVLSYAGGAAGRYEEQDLLSEF